MRQWYIKYPNGGMGHTILSHTLFACSQVNIDLTKLFSATGDAHYIAKINNSILKCHHGYESVTTGKSVLIEVTVSDWSQVLKCKLSYEKWYKSFPDIYCFENFGFSNPQSGELWLENLTYKYFDVLSQSSHTSNPQLPLDHYIDGDFAGLIGQVENQLGWCWNQNRSQQFYNELLLHNARYLSWLDHFKSIVASAIDDCGVTANLVFWEKAMLLAMLCKKQNCDPRQLPWTDDRCFLDTDSVECKQIFEWIKYNGKTF